ncbi:MAG: hypothetical protein ACFHVJ_15810 [Aestuariibacter sp.]
MLSTVSKSFIQRVITVIAFFFLTTNSFAWEAKVTSIMQHRNTVAVYLSPNPGAGRCDVGQPYLLPVVDSEEHRQKFAMILAAMTADMKVLGYDDGCDSAIWGKSRPKIERLMIIKQ